MKKLFTGVCTALITPFLHGEVDFISLSHIINNQIDAGVDAILVLGTTGESATLNTYEKKAIIKFAVEITAGRIPVIAGIGGNNTAAIIELGAAAHALGADGVLITAPYYNKATQSGLVKHFSAIADAVRLPMIIYNVPGRTGMNIDPATYLNIAKARHTSKYFAGIKECNFDQLSAARAILPGRIAVYSGDDIAALPAYALGADGVISVASNLKPREVREIYTAFKTRGNIRARKLFYEQLPFYKSLFTEVNPIPIKYYMSREGHCANELRPPLTPLSQQI